MPDAFAVNVPGSKREDIGYTQIAAEFSFDENFMQHLHILNTSSKGLDSIIANAVQLNDAYYNVGDDLLDYCKAGKTSYECKKEGRARIKQVVRRASKVLHKMMVTKNQKDYANLYANFGKHLWSNPFVFRSFLKRAGDCGLFINFDIIGEKISYFNRTFRYEKTNNCVLSDL